MQLYDATPSSWKVYKPCRAPTMLSSLLFAYKANGMVDVDE